MNNKVVVCVIIGLSFVVGCFSQTLPVLDSCIVCSSATRTTCATHPDSHTRQVCEGVITGAGCYTRIHNGLTLRGCTSDLDEAVISQCHNETCLTCVGIGHQPVYGCNNLIFPELRRQCHRCIGPVNGTCDEVPTELATVCELFDPNDRCFIHRTDTTITRGCLSDATRCQNQEPCIICEVNGCNNAHGSLVPIAPGSAATNKISVVMLSTAFIFALAKWI